MFHATTIVAVKKGNTVAIAGDGQVTMGETTIMKQTAKKVRRLFGGKVVARDLPGRCRMPLLCLKNLKVIWKTATVI